MRAFRVFAVLSLFSSFCLWRYTAGGVSKKNPNVDTSFLPDRERERGMLEQREKLKKEWLEDQERTKSEMFVYFDRFVHM